jgi:hypothetical protein
MKKLIVQMAIVGGMTIIGGCASALFAQDATPPAFAAAVGYTHNTFSSTFDSSQVDIKNTTNSGYKWYISRIAGAGVTPLAGIILNSDGSITLENNGGGFNDGIQSVGIVKGGWVGTVFGGGGYFEAILKFDPQTVTNVAKGFPAWWSIAIEHEDKNLNQWPGQAKGYAHYAEPDFFEWNIDGMEGVPPKTYNGSMIDWSGIFTPETGYPVRKLTPWKTKFNTTPSATDFNQYHKFGWLWVPATATTKGYAQYYFDDQPSTDRVSWTQFTHQAPTPAKQMDPWTFGILDQQQLVLILGSGATGAMTVQSVNVWQKSDRSNGKDGVIPTYLSE